MRSSHFAPALLLAPLFLSIPVLAPALAEDVYRHEGLAPEEAAKAMTVPEGFSVKLFAGEPDVRQPIAFALDDRGRLWVAEAYSYPVRQPEDKARDRILIFEDADGDGRFDSRKVFIERLNLVSGLELGFGGVWVGAAPQFLFIPDRDGDDAPDGPPEVLLDGWGYQDTHETLNAFMWGPDGWLYGCHGVFTHSRVGKPGAPEAERQKLNAGIWRYHPLKHVFEVFIHGTSNPWGVDFDDRGQAFLTACVIPHLYHVIQGGRYERQGGDHFNPYTYDDLKTIADHRHWVGGNPHGGNNRSDAAGGGHAHCGAMVYLGGAWPAAYRNALFFNNIHGQRINVDRLEPEGSGYVGRHAPDFILSNDRWSQILNLRYGPDGQVYMIDWYDRQACHLREVEAHDRSNGRIFKVAYRAAGASPAPGPADLKKRSDEELAALQLSPNDWHVRHARRILGERAAGRALAPGAREALVRLALEHEDETRRLRGLWALHVTGNLSEPLTLRVLSDPSPYLRAWSIQLATENREPAPAMLERFAALAREDPSPVARLYLASAAGRLPLERRWPILEGLIAHGEDAADQNLPLLYWYAAEPLAEKDPRRALELAARSKIPLMKVYLARRIASEGTPEALALVVRTLAGTEDLAAQLALLQGTTEALKGRREAPAPPEWASAFEKVSANPLPDARWLLLELGVKFREPRALASFREAVLDRKADPERRRKALAALLGAKDQALARSLQALLGDPALRGDALRGLAAYDDASTPTAVLAAYGSLSLAEKRDALGTLASRAGYARSLLEAVREKKVPSSDLPAEVVRQMRNLKDAGVDERIERIWGLVRETEEEKKKLIARYKRMLSAPAKEPPDLARGRAIFQRTCQQCHTLFGVGEKVGPELTGANRGDLDYLLSNVLDPGALVGKDYLAHVVLTRDGRVLTGLVRENDPASLKVLTANETVIVPRREVRSQVESDGSMMPDDLLKAYPDQEVRDVFAYLGSPVQTPLLATPENLKGLFSGKDLMGWEGDRARFLVEDGEIVGRSPGLERDEVLRSELLLSDFRMTLKVKVVPDEGKSAILLRTESPATGESRGYQAGLGQGRWGTLERAAVGAGASAKAPSPCGERAGDWNDYEITARGSDLRVSLNGKPCGGLDDPGGPRRGAIGLLIGAGGPLEVRVKDLRVELLAGTAP